MSLPGRQRPGERPTQWAAGWLVPFRGHPSAAPRISYPLVQGFGAGDTSGPRRELVLLRCAGEPPRRNDVVRLAARGAGCRA